MALDGTKVTENPDVKAQEREAAEARAKEISSIQSAAKHWVKDALKQLEKFPSYGPLNVLFTTSLSNGIPEGADPDLIRVLSDFFRDPWGTKQGELLKAMKQAHLVEICLPNLRADFNRGLRLIGSDRSVSPQPKELTFEQIEDALLKNKAEGVLKVAAMQGGGELFGLDENGKFLFKDRGNEPVMFGFDKKKKPIMVYNRDPAQMARITRYADYYQVYEAVYGAEDAPTGYELFPDAQDRQMRGMIAAVEEITGAPFVSSANGYDYRTSWLDNGREPDGNTDDASAVLFDYEADTCVVAYDYPGLGYDDRGAVRLLRV